MQSLVFLEPSSIKEVPFTTSDVIADKTENSYRSIQRVIENQIKRLETFGIMRFEITVSGKAGRPKKVYKLNEPQATLLITFLKNNDIVADFKTELVKQFYQMRAELQKRQIGKENLKPTRRTLTDEIQGNPDHGVWDYKLYLDLSYKMVTGKIAVTLRKERGASKTAVALDYMTADELAHVDKLTYKIAVLYEMGLSYSQIKAMLLNRQMIGKTDNNL